MKSEEGLNRSTLSFRLYGDFSAILFLFFISSSASHIASETMCRWNICHEKNGIYFPFFVCVFCFFIIKKQKLTEAMWVKNWKLKNAERTAIPILESDVTITDFFFSLGKNWPVGYKINKNKINRNGWTGCTYTAGHRIPDSVRSALLQHTLCI